MYADSKKYLDAYYGSSRSRDEEQDIYAARGVIQLRPAMLHGFKSNFSSKVCSCMTQQCPHIALRDRAHSFIGSKVPMMPLLRNTEAKKALEKGWDSRFNARDDEVKFIPGYLS